MTNEQYSPAAQAVSDAANQVYWDWCEMCPASAETIAAAEELETDIITKETLYKIMKHFGWD